MKKKLLVPAGIVLVLAVAYCAGSWYTGKQAQAQVYDAVNQINQQLDVSWPVGQTRPTLQIQDYQRGWFSSDVRYVFTFSDDSGHIQTLRLEDALQHGPFPWGALGAGDFRPLLAYSRIQLTPTEFVQPWFDAREGASPMQIDTRVTFGGVAHSLWTFHPFAYDGEAGQIDFSGGSVRVDYDRTLKKSDAQGRFDSLKWADGTGGQGTVTNFTVEGHNTVAAQGDIQVHNVVKVDRITAQHPDGPDLTIENMAVKLDSARTGVLLDGALAYEFGKIRIGHADLGAIRAGMRAEHIDFIALEGLLAAWGQVSADGEELDPDEEKQLEAPLRTMLASSPLLAVDPLGWTTSEGRTHALFSVHFKPAADAVPGPADLGRLIEQSLRQVRLEVSVSRPMVIQLAGQISPEAGEQTRAIAAMLFDQYAARLQQAGLVQVKDEVVSLNLSYAGGEVGLDDKRMSVQEFMALVQRVLG
ncbi:MAG: YdgA family protein [Alcaligenaceae bacterium]|nr:YdgA family protein [Alcaligenaceae bacterium]